MSDIASNKAIVNFLKTVSTATRCLELSSDPQLNALPDRIALHIEELEDLLVRFSLEAEALLWRAGHGHELYLNPNKGGKK